MVSEFNQWREILPSNMAAGLFIERLLGNKQSRMVERIGSIRNISYLLPMCHSFWEKCINSQKNGLGCSTPLIHQIQNSKLTSPAKSPFLMCCIIFKDLYCICRYLWLVFSWLIWLLNHQSGKNHFSCIPIYQLQFTLFYIKCVWTRRNT